MEPKFTVSEVFSTSWKYTKSQIWVLAGLLIGFTILSCIISVFSMPAQGSTKGVIITSLISLVIQSLFMLGYTKNLLQTMDGEEPQFSAYGQQARKLITAILASLLYSVAMVVGLIFLIIPGLYLAIRLQFYLILIVEEDCGIIESLQKSWELTRGQAMPLFALFFAAICIEIIGFILLFIGIFVATPLVLMMQCYAFRKLNTISKTTEEIQSESIH